MREYREVQHPAIEFMAWTCNKCGVRREVGSGGPDFTSIDHRCGFGTARDGDKYSSDICEPCMDEIYATFKIPPTIHRAE